MARLLRLWFLIVSLVFLAGCSSTELRASNKTSLPSNINTDRLFTIYVRGGMGTAFPIGLNKIATASHMMVDEVDGGVDVRNSWGQVCWGEFNSAGMDDEQAATIIVDNVVLAGYYKVAPPKICSWATIRTPRGEFQVWLLNTTVFVGFTPIPGESGSPVIQNGKAIGVLTHRCPQGGLYRPLKEWSWR